MNPHHYAAVIGIDRYPALRDLHSARADAVRVRDWLIDDQGGAVPPENLRLLLAEDHEMVDGVSQNEAVPRFEQFEDLLFELRQLCEAQSSGVHWKDSRLYVYVSGHGIAPTPNEAALLMANAGPGRFGRNFSCDQFIEFFQGAQTFHEVVFFADCCRETLSPAPIQAPTWDTKIGNNGAVVPLPGYATHFGDLAFEDEDPDTQRSYFTQALLEGLQGQAANDDGVIDSVGLATFVTQRVRVLTRHKLKPQVPSMPTDPGSPIVFRAGVDTDASSQAKTHTVTIALPTEFTGTAQLLDGGLEEVGTHSVAAGVAAASWQVALQNGLYEVVSVDDPAVVFAGQGRFKVMGEDVDVEL